MKKPQLNATYVTGLLFGLEFNRPDLKERELKAFKECGLYYNVDFHEINGYLSPKVTLNEKGVKYWSSPDLTECFQTFTLIEEKSIIKSKHVSEMTKKELQEIASSFGIEAEQSLSALRKQITGVMINRELNKFRAKQKK